MEIKEFIELYKKNGEDWIRGQFVLYDPSQEPKEDEILGIAKEDVKKGQIVKLEL